MGPDPDLPRPHPIAPVVLCILDGWGIAPPGPGNAISQANTPNWDRFHEEGITTQLEASGQAVGLPAGQMGNSEVGHLNMGAGRIVAQDIVRIDHDIATGRFLENKPLLEAMQEARAKGKTVHLIGLVGPGGVHSHERHHFALIELARKTGHDDLQHHAVLDGRDTPPQSAADYLQGLEKRLRETGAGKIATVQGRYWAMDRDQRWDRTEKAYRLLVHNEGEKANDAQAALKAAYERDESDEFVAPTHLEGARPIVAGDTVVFVNFRPDRARQLTRALGEPGFQEFPVEHLDLDLVIMTQYQREFKEFARVAYPPVKPKATLGETVSKAGHRQLRIAETEKYAHVTYFINGGREEPFQSEDRILVPSPRIATYDLQPEMNAPEVTRRLIEVLLAPDPPQLVILNFANPDMVGHTGNLQATIQAIESIDDALGQIAQTTHDIGGALLITADHGNAEELLDEVGDRVTKHTTNPVPLVLLTAPEHLPPGTRLNPGILADIAPTVLGLMGLEKPAAMDRQSLLSPRAS